MKEPRKAMYRISIEKREWTPDISKEWVIQSDDPRKYGYAYSDGERIETTTILVQELDPEHFDIRAVIKAVNGL